MTPSLRLSSAGPKLLLAAVLAVACQGPTEVGEARPASLAAPRPPPDPARRPGASGGPLLPEQAAIDVQHVALDVAVDPAGRSIIGRMELLADVVADLSAVVLHLDQNLVAGSMSVDGAALPFAHDVEAGLLRCELPRLRRAGDTLRVAVDYGGRPREAVRAPWDGGFTWSETPDGRPWITTTCQGEGADLWWPCKDHPSDKPESLDLRVTVPAGLFCASNGTLQSTTDDADGTTTFHWRVGSPISNYNVALNVGPFVALQAEYESIAGTPVPVTFWVLPQDEEKGRAFLPTILGDLASLEQLCGPYPFRDEKYGVVQTPHLGMEHQTVIAYGNAFRPGDPEGYDWLHHHELSHEWWGNLVTARDWKDMWIHEGIGTYMQALHLQRRYGEEVFQREMARTRGAIRNRRAVAPLASCSTRDIYFDADGGYDGDIYSKGSWVMHTLRWLLGERAFADALLAMAWLDPDRQHLTGGAQVRFSDSAEIASLAEQVAGRDLSWFFGVYLHQPALPALQVERRADALELAWIVPGGGAFPLPVPVRVDGQLQRVEMPGGRASLPLPPGAAVEIDPERWLLREPDPEPEPAAAGVPAAEG